MIPKKELQKINNLVSVHIMGWSENYTGGIGTWKTDDCTGEQNIIGFNPSGNIRHTIMVAKKVELFKNHILHQMLGNVSPRIRWTVAKRNKNGYFENIASAYSKEVAICLAALKIKNVIK